MGNDTNAAGVLSSIVASIKIIARNVCRMRLISARQTKISNLEGDLKAQDERVKLAETHVANVKERLAVSEYEKTKLDPAHPKAASRLKDAEETVEELKKQVKAYEEDLDEVKKDVAAQKKTINEAIKEQNDGIANIEAGKTLVSKDELDETVQKLINEHGRETVRSL